MHEYKNILVYGELDGEKLSPMTTQLLGIGERLAANLKENLHLLLLGTDSSQAAQEGHYYGAKKVYLTRDPLMENYMTDSYLQVMEHIVEEQKPCIVLFGQNEKGIDLAPRLAFRLGTGITLDCIDLGVDSENGPLKCAKPVFGGKAEAVYCNHTKRPQIATIRDRAFEPAFRDDSRAGETIVLSLPLDSSKIRTRFVEKQRDDSQALVRQLMSAINVISGGRGLRNKEGVDILHQTAQLIQGSIAGSRPAVDNGWIPNALQVGLTGQKISPQLYLAVGISGAIQHMAGCMKSNTIVAINEDENAPIFRFSHYGVVGDYRGILRGFNDELSRFKENK